MKKKKVILIIGGHDPTSGAGISADIETSSHFGCHAISLLTCTTIQNTNKIFKVNKMPKNYIINGFRELISEFKINVIKIGLIPNIQASKEILELLSSKKIKNTPVIIDPIIKSGNGKILTKNNNLNFLLENIYPKAKLLTPNLQEFNTIKNLKKKDCKDKIENIIITDYEIKNNFLILKLINNKNNFEKNFKITKYKKTYHGTGCTFATAIACNIANQKNIENSIKISLRYIKKTILLSNISGKKQSFLNRNFL